ncbi:hypothetical protein WJX72_012334 [[Myrmecia] bisecta]|uniref:Uncharacterized protein n=1 Tax=[Myrmecia] bisecta TaxID=41462 RepID=A0AAW1R9V3_9CHLO
MRVREAPQQETHHLPHPVLPHSNTNWEAKGGHAAEVVQGLLPKATRQQEHASSARVGHIDAPSRPVVTGPTSGEQASKAAASHVHFHAPSPAHPYGGKSNQPHKESILSGSGKPAVENPVIGMVLPASNQVSDPAAATSGIGNRAPDHSPGMQHKNAGQPAAPATPAQRDIALVQGKAATPPAPEQRGTAFVQGKAAGNETHGGEKDRSPAGPVRVVDFCDPCPGAPLDSHTGGLKDSGNPKALATVESLSEMQERGEAGSGSLDTPQRLRAAEQVKRVAVDSIRAIAATLHSPDMRHGPGNELPARTVETFPKKLHDMEAAAAESMRTIAATLHSPDMRHGPGDELPARIAESAPKKLHDIEEAAAKTMRTIAATLHSPDLRHGPKDPEDAAVELARKAAELDTEAVLMEATLSELKEHAQSGANVAEASSGGPAGAAGVGHKAAAAHWSILEAAKEAVAGVRHRFEQVVATTSKQAHENAKTWEDKMTPHSREEALLISGAIPTNTEALRKHEHEAGAADTKAMDE